MAKQEKAICLTCDKEFSYYRSTLRGNDAKYCSHKCQPPWNKGVIAHNECLGCGKTIRIFRKYCSRECYIKNVDPCQFLPESVAGENNPNWQGGKPSCRNCNKTLSTYKNKYGLCFDCVWEECSGENHPLWDGGPEEERTKIRKSREYRLWRTSVFERDEYTCQVCQKKGVYLEADHIKPFSLYPELRLAIDNGRTLCKECHLQYGWRKRK